MSNVLKYIGFTLYLLAFLFFLSGGLSLFYKEAQAVSIEKNRIVLHQNSYGGGKTFDGGNFIFTLFKYSYKINNLPLNKGFWVKINVKREAKYDNKIFYNQAFPTISVMERGIPIFWVLLFLFSGFICMYISKWFKQLKTH